MKLYIYIFILLSLSTTGFAITRGEVDDYLSSLDLGAENLSADDYSSFAEQINILEKSGFKRNPDAKETKRIKEQITDGEACNGSSWFGSSYSKTFQYDTEFVEAYKSSPSMSAECKKKIFKEYLKKKYSKKDPRENKYCRKNSCELIKAAFANFENLVASLVYDQFGLENAQIYCSNRKKVESKGDIEELMSDFARVSSCSDLGVGETKVVNNYLNNVDQKYAITKDGDKSYTATFNINFYNAPKSGDKEITPEERKKMYDHVHSCLQENNQYLKDSRGNNLKLKVVAPEEATSLPSFQRPPKVDVGIDFANTRAHSKRYTADIQCSTVVHELLHLTGLYDEYEEGAFGKYVHTETGKVLRRKYVSDAHPEKRDEYKYIADYNHCRAIPKTPSIMANDRVALSQKRSFNFQCKCKSEFPKSESGYQPRNTYKECRESFAKYPNYFLDHYKRSWGADLESSIRFSKAVPVLMPEKVSMCNIDSSLSKKTTLKSYDEIKKYKFYEMPKRIGNTLYIKKNSLRANDGRFGSVWSYTTKCNCDRNEDFCAEVEARIKESIKDPSIVGQQQCPSFMEKVDDDENFKDNPKEGMIIVPGPKSPTGAILKNAHLERVISGDCKSKVTRYSECGKYAYIRLEDSCDERPNYCKDESQWLDSVE